MLNQTKKTQSDISHTEQSAEENQNKETFSTELLHREEIEGTPFEIIGNDENGYCLVIGKYRLTAMKETILEVKEELIDELWNIILRVIIVMHKEIIDVDKEQEKKETLKDLPF